MCGNFGLCEDDCTLEKSWMTNGIVKKIPLMLMIVEGEFWSNRVSNKEIGEYRETIWGEEGECGQIASLYLEWRRRWIRSMRRNWRTSNQHLEWRYKSSEGLGGLHWLSFGWKFMGKFAHGLGSANSFHVVKRSRLGGHSQCFFFWCCWDRLVRCRSLSKSECPRWRDRWREDWSI